MHQYILHVFKEGQRIFILYYLSHIKYIYLLIICFIFNDIEPSQTWTPTELVPDEEEMEANIMELMKMPENPNLNDLFP